MLIDPIATHGTARANCLAVVDLESGRRLDWTALDRAVNRVANWLIAELGACSGARVATLARNCADMLILQHGCVRKSCLPCGCSLLEQREVFLLGL